MAICYGLSVHRRNEITRVRARDAVTSIPPIVEPSHAGHDPRHVRSPRRGPAITEIVSFHLRGDVV